MDVDSTVFGGVVGKYVHQDVTQLEGLLDKLGLNIISMNEYSRLIESYKVMKEGTRETSGENIPQFSVSMTRLNLTIVRL